MVEVLIQLGVPALLLGVGFVVGNSREKAHYNSLLEREKVLLHNMPTRSDKGPRLGSGETFLVTGSVVIASDYFKNFIGNLKNFFGGRLSSHETLLDRARREALIRMREKALKQGAHQVVDVHLETSFLDQMGAEITAYGTAVKN